MTNDADGSDRTIDQTARAKLVGNAIFARRMRDESFPSGLFGEPAWDMLLDLYLAEVEQRRLSVGAACIGAAVPTTTALRWLETLMQYDLICRYPDKLDARRCFVELTPKGRALMNGYFSRVPSRWDGA